MKKFAGLLSVTLMLSVSTVAFAGGPIAVKEEKKPVVVVGGGASVGILPIVIGTAVVAGALSSVSSSSGSHGSNF